MNSHLNDRSWDQLLRAIDQEKVVLVIGDKLLRVKIGDKSYTMKQYVLKRMAEELEVDYTPELDFYDLSYEVKLKEWRQKQSNPYNETTYILEDLPRKSYDTDLLRKLLSIDKFKLVLTTGFDDIALTLMQEIYGKDNVASYSYEKNSNRPDIPTYFNKYLHYHLFGKADPTPNSFVLTEDDLLDFIHSWMDQNYRPQQLSYKLGDRYLLVIGCDYPNWLFRFFFHSLKHSISQINASGGSISGTLADNNLEPELISFLQRMEANVHEDAENFIEELSARWTKYKSTHGTTMPQGNDLQAEQGQPSTPAEAFISYASEDYETAKEIASTFEELGLHVWFDKKALEPGDEYERLIRQRIQECPLFIPVLSPQTAKVGGPRFYRKEWKWASDMSQQYFGTGRNYIMPVVIEGYKMESNHPFIDYHAIDLSEPDERKGKIRSMIRKFRQSNN